MSPQDLKRVGVHAERGEESVEHLRRLYAGHDLLHLRQIARIRETVCPAESARSARRLRSRTRRALVRARMMLLQRLLHLVPAPSLERAPSGLSFLARSLMSGQHGAARVHRCRAEKVRGDLLEELVVGKPPHRTHVRGDKVTLPQMFVGQWPLLDLHAKDGRQRRVGRQNRHCGGWFLESAPDPIERHGWSRLGRLRRCVLGLVRKQSGQ